MDIILIKHIFSVDTIFDMASVIFAEEMSQDLSRSRLRSLSLSLPNPHMFMYSEIRHRDNMFKTFWPDPLKTTCQKVRTSLIVIMFEEFFSLL